MAAAKRALREWRIRRAEKAISRIENGIQNAYDFDDYEAAAHLRRELHKARDRLQQLQTGDMDARLDELMRRCREDEHTPTYQDLLKLRAR